MTNDVDSSKSKSLAVDSLLVVAAPNLSDSGRLDSDWFRLGGLSAAAAVPGTTITTQCVSRSLDVRPS